MARFPRETIHKCLWAERAQPTARQNLQHAKIDSDFVREDKTKISCAYIRNSIRLGSAKNMCIIAKREMVLSYEYHAERARGPSWSLSVSRVQRALRENPLSPTPKVDRRRKLKQPNACS